MEYRNYPGRGSSGAYTWDQMAATAALIVLALVGVYVVYAGIYTVEAHQRAVIFRFGRYREPAVEPGLHLCIPIVDEVVKVGLEEHSLRLPYGASADRPEEASEEETLMLTGDLNVASVEWTVQWQVVDPYQYAVRFYQEDNPDYPQEVIITASRTVMNRLIGDYSIFEVLTEKRREIEEEAREATQKILDQYACGIAIRDLEMQRVSPPARVRQSFNEVNVALQKKEQLENEANKERNTLLPAAHAQKDKLVREAEGYAQRRRAEATGEISALKARFEAYQKSPEQTRQRLYLEAMEEVLANVESTTVIDAGVQDKTIPLLDLGKETVR